MRRLSAAGRALLLCSLIAGLCVVVGLPTSPVLAEDGAEAHSLGSPSAPRTPLAPRRGAIDFPSLPDRCYDPTAPGVTKPSACRINRFDRDRPTLVLWGDSHAQQYLPAVKKAVRGRRLNLVAFVSGSCPPAWVPRSSGTYPNCEAKNRAALDWIRSRSGAGQDVTVLLGSSWSRWRQFYRQVREDERAGRPPRFDKPIVRVIELQHDGTPPLFRSLARTKVRVDLIDISGVYPPRDKPECPEGETPYRCALPRADVIQDEAATTRFLTKQAAKLRRPYRLVDTSPAYCDEISCFGTVGDRPTFYDSAHLSESLTSTMKQYFVPTAKDAARRR